MIKFNDKNVSVLSRAEYDKETGARKDVYVAFYVRSVVFTQEMKNLKQTLEYKLEQVESDEVTIVQRTCCGSKCEDESKSDDESDDDTVKKKNSMLKKIESHNRNGKRTEHKSKNGQIKERLRSNVRTLRI